MTGACPIDKYQRDRTPASKRNDKHTELFHCYKFSEYAPAYWIFCYKYLEYQFLKTCFFNVV